MTTVFGTRDRSPSAAIVEVLEQGGTEFVFGMPGGKTNLIFDALYGAEAIRTILVREEMLATVMAEAYGRATGVPGVAIGQTSWLLGNGGLGILEAHLGSAPVVLLGDLTDHAPFSQHAPYQAATGHYGTWDAAAALRGMTKLVMVAHDPVEAVQCTQLALKHACAGEPGPVAVLYHSSALSGSVGVDSRPRLYPTQRYLAAGASMPSEEHLRSAVELLTAARNPVIVAGNGVRNASAYQALQELAERLGAAVTTTAAGKGVFPETHALSVGVMGNFGEPAANEIVSSADVVLALGTKLGPSDTSFGNPSLIRPDRQQLVQVDIEARNLSWTYPVQHPLLGDLATVLARFNSLLNGAASHRARERTDALDGSKQRLGSFASPMGESEDSPVHPQRVIAEVSDAARRNGCFVTCDAGENRLFMSRYFRTSSAGRFLQPAASGGMGYAIPAALAVKLAYPDARALAVCGDGGFGISMNGLFTAVEESIPITVVVLNNRSLGWVRHGQGDRVIASVLDDFDHAGIARSMGCAGHRVEDPADLPKVLDDAVTAARPTVIDVLVSRAETYLDIASPLNSWG